MARKSDPEPLIRGGLALLFFCALAIGGFAHFGQVLTVMVVGLVMIAAIGGLAFLAWKTLLRGTTKSPLSIATGFGASATPPPVISSVAALRRIDWYQFEKLIARLLTLEGHQVRRSGGARADGGVDLIADKNGRKTVVQCKHWKNWKIKEATIREMIGTLKLHGGDHLSLYTLNPSTIPADQLARNQGIEIVTEDKILARIRAVGLGRFNDLLDPNFKCCPKCDAPMKLHTGGFRPFWGCTQFPRCQGKIEAC